MSTRCFSRFLRSEGWCRCRLSGCRQELVRDLGVPDSGLRIPKVWLAERVLGALET